MNKNQRKNRAKKKEVPQDKWDNDLESIKRQYEYGGKRRVGNKDPEER